MKKGIIFDLDGTLWEVTDVTYEKINKIAKKYKLKEVKIETINSIFGRNTLECARMCFPQVDDEKAIKLMNESADEINEELKENGGDLYPNLEETLKKLLESYMLFIVSNSGYTEYIEAFLKSSGLQNFFTDYIAAGALKMTKAEGIKKIVEDYKLEKAVYIGDTNKDMESAYEANVPFIHAKYGYMKSLECKNSIESIDDLPNVIKKFL